MSRFYLLCSLLLAVSFLAQSLATTTQNPLRSSSSSISKNVTLDFDDIPTHQGFGNISSYHNLDFSSFYIVNTSAAAAEGRLSKKDTACATSSDNALIAHRAKTPALWPRIALNPLAHVLPGEAPFFNVHGFSLKPMKHSDSVVCITVATWGLDEQQHIRSWSSIAACVGPRYPGGHFNITDIFPGWGQASNMIEMFAEAAVISDDGLKWVDWPFCVDDIVLEVLGEEENWEWPKPWWPEEGYPLLPPLAPFKFDDEGLEAMVSGKYRPFYSEGDRAEFDAWRLSGDDSVFLSFPRPLGTS